MKLVYIAGPYTAATDEEIEANILAAEELARRIIARTDKVACLVPHSIGRNFKRGPGSPQYWYDATLRMLEPCDALITVGNWRASKGTRNEVIASHECCRSVRRRGSGCPLRSSLASTRTTCATRRLPGSPIRTGAFWARLIWPGTSE